jgi:peroxiredoxin
MEQFLIISSILLWGVALINLLITLAVVRKLSPVTTPPGLKKGTIAPAFSANTLRGENVTLETYAKRKVVFIFISPNCGPCRESLPTYQALYPKAKQNGVEIVLVSIQDDDKTLQFVSEFNLNQPVLIAPMETNSFAKDYNALSTPSYCMLGERGIVLSSGFTSLEWEDWKELVISWDQEATIQLVWS